MPLEIVNPTRRPGTFRFALFDFDGTLSLIREGWVQVMVPFFVEELMATPNREEQGEIERVVREFVDELTGKQTIYQCLQLQEEVSRRGGEPKEALWYKHEYLRRLDIRIEGRLDGLKSGTMQPEDLMVPGSRALMEFLVARGVICYLASGTDLQYVLAETEALGLMEFFSDRVYAAVDDYKSFSKQMIIEKLIAENNISGEELLVIGDGYVEIENGRAAGGYALGVASFESDPGQVDEWKRERLIRAGADIIVPDYSDMAELASHLFGS